MGRKIDWDYWRIQYVTSEDQISLEALSNAPNAPAYDSLKKRSSRESWPEQRTRFRHQSADIVHRDQVVSKAAADVKQIVDSAEMLTRHMQAARLVGGKAITRLKTIDPNELSPREALDLLKWAIEAERLTEGLATAKIESDAKIENSGKIQINVIGVEP